MRRRWLGGALLGLVVATACNPADPTSSQAGSTGSASVKAKLAPLVLDDSPKPATKYRRSEWPHWVDVDGNRCDSRQDALIAQSTTKAQVDPIDCSVITGDWVSPYDGIHTTNPGDLDIDHVVPLENAHQSGGWRWTAEQRRDYANDGSNLLVVSAASNRSKGSRSPDQWRPPRREAWCLLARTWLGTKLKYHLTVRTAERDALGQMLDTCAP